MRGGETVFSSFFSLASLLSVGGRSNPQDFSTSFIDSFSVATNTSALAHTHSRTYTYTLVLSFSYSVV